MSRSTWITWTLTAIGTLGTLGLVSSLLTLPLRRAGSRTVRRANTWAKPVTTGRATGPQSRPYPDPRDTQDPPRSPGEREQPWSESRNTGSTTPGPTVPGSAPDRDAARAAARLSAAYCRLFTALGPPGEGDQRAEETQRNQENERDQHHQ